MRFFSYKFAISISFSPYTFFHWVLKEFLMEYQHIYVISKFSPIFLKGFKEFFHDMYIHTSSIFPTGFSRSFSIDYKTTKNIKFITRPQEEQIDQGGVLRRKIGLVINFHN